MAKQNMNTVQNLSTVESRRMIQMPVQDAYYGEGKSSIMQNHPKERVFGSRRMTTNAANQGGMLIQQNQSRAMNHQTNDYGDRSASRSALHYKPPLGPSPHQPAQWSKGHQVQGGDRAIHTTEMKITSGRGPSPVDIIAAGSRKGHQPIVNSYK